MNISTGYFADWRKHGRTKVHLVVDGHPLCNCQIGENSEYQWCGNGIVAEYIECVRCKKKCQEFLGEEKR
jgi:hypothetical protein